MYATPRHSFCFPFVNPLTKSLIPHFLRRLLLTPVTHSYFLYCLLSLLTWLHAVPDRRLSQMDGYSLSDLCVDLDWSLQICIAWRWDFVSGLFFGV